MAKRRYADILDPPEAEALPQSAQPAPYADILDAPAQAQAPAPPPPDPRQQAAEVLGGVERRAQELRDEPLLENPGQIPRVALEALIPGLDMARIQAGGEAMLGGDDIEERAAGARVSGGGVLKPALTGLGMAVGGGALGAARAGGAKALGKYAATQAGELGVGLAAEEGARYALEKMGVKPNTAAVLSNILTIPIGLDVAKRGFKAARGPEPEIHSVVAPDGPAPKLGADDAAKTAAATAPDPTPALEKPAGPKVTLSGGRGARTYTDIIDSSTASAERAAVIDQELDQIADELSALRPGSDDVAAKSAYRERALRLIEERQQLLEPPPEPKLLPAPATRTAGAAPPPDPAMAQPAAKTGDVLPLSREEARGRARKLEYELLQDDLPEVRKAQIEQELGQLRQYGFRGIADSPLDASAAQIEAQLFPEPLGPEVEGSLPSLSMQEREPNLDVAAALRAEQSPLFEEPARIAERPFWESSDPITVRQGDIESPVQAPFPEEGVDLTLRPETPVFSGDGPPLSPDLPAEARGVRPSLDFPRSPEEAASQIEQLRASLPASPQEAQLIDDRIRDLETFILEAGTAPPAPPSSIRDLGFEAVERYDPGTAFTLEPSRETLELNYPDLQRQAARYNRLKAESDKAVAEAAQIRQTLENNPDLTPEKRRSLSATLIALNDKIGAETRFQQAADARKAIDAYVADKPKERAFWKALLSEPERRRKAAGVRPDPDKTSAKSAARGLSKEAPSIGAGQQPAKRWVDPSDIPDPAQRKFRRDQSILEQRQLSNRLYSIEAQLADVQQRIESSGLEATGPMINLRDRLASEAQSLQASIAARAQSESAEAARRRIVDRLNDSDGPDSPTGLDQPGRGTIADWVGRKTLGLFYDSEWNFRRLADDVKDPAKRGKAKAALGEISDRYRDVKVYGTVRAARALTNIWKIGGPGSGKGLAKLSESERVNLFHVLSRGAEPANDHVALVAKAVRQAFDEVASSFEDLGGLAFDRTSGMWRPFMRRLDFVPNLAPPVRALAQDANVRRRVMDYMGEAHGIDRPSAEAMIDEYVALQQGGEGKGARRLIEFLQRTRQAANELEAVAMLDTFAQPRVRRSSSLEFGRRMELPFLDPDLTQSLPGWLHHNWERISWIEQFGQEIPAGAKVAGEVRKPVRRLDKAPPPDDPTAAYYKELETFEELLRAVNDADPKKGEEAVRMLNEALGNGTFNEKAQALSRFVRDLGVFRLGYLAVDNSVQAFLGSMLRGDVVSTLKSMRKSFGDEAWKIAMESGSRDITSDTINPIYYGDSDFSPGVMQKGIETFIKYTGIKLTEDYNRTLAPTVAHRYVDSLYQTVREGADAKALPVGFTDDPVKFAKSELKKLGLPADRAPTDEEMLAAAFRFDRDVNFQSDPWLRPEWSNTSWGKVMTQYMNWGYQMTRLVWQETWGRIDSGLKAKDANELARGLQNLIVLGTVYPAFGLTTRLARAYVKSLGYGIAAASNDMGWTDLPQYDDSPIQEYQDEKEEIGVFGEGLLGATRLGAIPGPFGDVVESTVRFGRPPDSPNLGGAVMGDMLKEVVYDPIMAWFTTAREELESRNPDLREPFDQSGAELIQGVNDRVLPFGDWFEPLTDPVVEELKTRRR